MKLKYILLATLFFQIANAAGQEKPNVVIVFIDNFGWGNTIYGIDVRDGIAYLAVTSGNLFVVDATTPAEPELVQEVQRNVKRLQDFKREIAEGRIIARFSTPDSLAVQIQAALFIGSVPR